jgi:hypothetical protein
VPFVPPGKDVVVIVSGGGGATVIEIARLAELPAASVTSKVTELLLAPVGVPLMTPEPLFKLNPAGNVPDVTVHLYGLAPPDTTRVAL